MFTELFGSSLFKSKFCICTILPMIFLSVTNCSDSGKDHLQIPSANDDKNYLVDQYVGAETCAECHNQVHEKWEGSHHFHAMELPNEQTVRADFNDSTFENYGVTTKFFRDQEKILGGN